MAHSDATISISRAALVQLLRHLNEAYTHHPTRKVRQALLITQHLLDDHT